MKIGKYEIKINAIGFSLIVLVVWIFSLTIAFLSLKEDFEIGLEVISKRFNQSYDNDVSIACDVRKGFFADRKANDELYDFTFNTDFGKAIEYYDENPFTIPFTEEEQKICDNINL